MRKPAGPNALADVLWITSRYFLSYRWLMSRDGTESEIPCRCRHFSELSKITKLAAKRYMESHSSRPRHVGYVRQWLIAANIYTAPKGFVQTARIRRRRQWRGQNCGTEKRKWSYKRVMNAVGRTITSITPQCMEVGREKKSRITWHWVVVKPFILNVADPFSRAFLCCLAVPLRWEGGGGTDARTI